MEDILDCLTFRHYCFKVQGQAAILDIIVPFSMHVIFLRLFTPALSVVHSQPFPFTKPPFTFLFPLLLMMVTGEGELNVLDERVCWAVLAESSTTLENKKKENKSCHHIFSCKEGTDVISRHFLNLLFFYCFFFLLNPVEFVCIFCFLFRF